MLLVCAGRVVLINYGPNEGKLATIVDVVDGNRVRPLACCFLPVPRPCSLSVPPWPVACHGIFAAASRSTCLLRGGAQVMVYQPLWCAWRGLRGYASGHTCTCAVYLVWRFPPAVALPTTLAPVPSPQSHFAFYTHVLRVCVCDVPGVEPFYLLRCS
jgi:hypothetical protein